jgi:putative tryptophan/tyrosine transport system substrate-binding protein
MRRREFLTLVGGASTWPFTALAQRPAMPVVGFLHGGSAAAFTPQAAAFREGLRRAGYVDGQKVAIEYRWVEGRFEKLPALADELVRSHVTVIAAIGGDIVARR